jgi:hypothetical protein
MGVYNDESAPYAVLQQWFEVVISDKIMWYYNWGFYWYVAIGCGMLAEQGAFARSSYIK